MTIENYTDADIAAAITWLLPESENDHQAILQDMLRAWIAERKAAREGVTDEMAFVAADQVWVGHDRSKNLPRMRRALEAVAPMLRGEALSEPAHDPEDGYEISANPTVRAAYADGYDVGYAHGKSSAPASGEAVAVVGERGSVSWRSERILPVGALLYAEPMKVPEGLHTVASVRAELVEKIGDCCMGGDPACAAGCLFEVAASRNAFAVPAKSRPMPDDSEAVSACLGDDAAAMLDRNAEDERALNMQRAAQIIDAMLAAAPGTKAVITAADVCDALDRIPLSERKPAKPIDAVPGADGKSS